MFQRITKYLNNPISLIGFSIIALSLLTIIFFITIDLFFEETSPYLGIITFVILPVFLVFGLILVPIGSFREKIRLHKKGETPHRLLRVDFNDPHHRVIFSIFSVLTVIFIMILSVASYHAFELTESVEFCGRLCHSVMDPEYIAYSNSPHARVSCVECHVGEGASWYVKSKLSGAYQVYATLLNKFPKPVPTPIKNLRPAQETCERCHWPQNFFNDKIVTWKYFLKNEENTPGFYTLLMRIGGGSPEMGLSSGIHWHMNIKNEIHYITTDDSRMTIPWIRMKDENGNITVYQDTEGSLSENLIDSLPKRQMDCMDCHNRPSHIYKSPDEIINHAMALGEIDRNIPEIRQIASEALIQDYSTNKNALDSIKLYINNYYQENYPDDYDNLKEKTSASIISLQRGYSRNFFPEMKVRWDVYPDHIGHKTFPGCMRCHDGKHIDQNGRPLSHECNVCHTVLAQGQGESLGQLSYQGVEFKHPEDIDEEWKTTICSECHNGE